MSPRVTVTAVGLDIALSKINVAKAQVGGPMQGQILDAIGGKGVEILRGYLPSKTGRTKKAVSFSVQGDDVEIGLGQTTPSGLGKWLFEGTKMHVLQGSPLRFQSSGDVVYRGRAKHPGTKGLDLTGVVADLEKMADVVVADHVRMLEPLLSD